MKLTDFSKAKAEANAYNELRGRSHQPTGPQVSPKVPAPSGNLASKDVASLAAKLKVPRTP